MDRHVHLIAILWIVYGILGILFALAIFLLVFGISFIPGMGDIAPGILRIVATAAGFFFLVFSLPELIAGVGLQKRREWGRILTLIVSFFNLVNIPLGTALSIYSFVILLREDTAKLFQRTI